VLERIVEVKLWLVPKENNKEAEFLAKAALMHGGHGYGIAQV
jgi:hypothetical protein